MTAGRHVEPEVYPRPDGTVYMCGEPEKVPLPPCQADVTVDPALVSNIKAVVGSVSHALGAASTIWTSASYLPLSPDRWGGVGSGFNHSLCRCGESSVVKV